jgi:hypothetical protein
MLKLYCINANAALILKQKLKRKREQKLAEQKKKGKKKEKKVFTSKNWRD